MAIALSTFRTRMSGLTNVDTSGVHSWTARDIEGWRKELREAASDDTTARLKGIALATAAASYVAGGGWGQYVKETACPPVTRGGLCTNLSTEAMAVFPLYAVFFSVAVVAIVYLMWACRSKLDDKIKDLSVSRRGDQMLEELGIQDEEQVAAVVLLAHHKTFDLVAGGWTYNCVVLWTIALHGPFSYTTGVGVWSYFCAMLVFSSVMLVLFFEAIPPVTAYLRRRFPKIASKPADEPHLALIARAVGGSTAWLLGIALMNALEVTAAQLRSPEGAKLTYYWGGLHNVPLLVRYLLCIAVLLVMLPTVTWLKRSKRHVIRDTLVGALMQYGEWSTAAFMMRFIDRTRGLILPMLANVGAQALFRSFENTLIPHEWDILWNPETLDKQTGGGCAGAKHEATRGTTQTLRAAGVRNGAAKHAANEILNASISQSVSNLTRATHRHTGVAASDAAVTNALNSGAEAAHTYMCSLNNDCGKNAGGTCLKWMVTNGTDVFGQCCPYQVLWGLPILMLVYAVAMTVGASYFLVWRDRRMHRVLEAVVELTEAEDAHAGQKQREFALRWELSAMVAGVVGYINGKVWNDVLTGPGGIFSKYKKESALPFAMYSTCVCIIMAVLQTTGKADKWLGMLMVRIETARGRGQRTGGEGELISPVWADDSKDSTQSANPIAHGAET